MSILWIICYQIYTMSDSIKYFWKCHDLIGLLVHKWKFNGRNKRKHFVQFQRKQSSKEIRRKLHENQLLMSTTIRLNDLQSGPPSYPQCTAASPWRDFSCTWKQKQKEDGELVLWSWWRGEDKTEGESEGWINWFYLKSSVIGQATV